MDISNTERNLALLWLYAGEAVHDMFETFTENLSSNEDKYILVTAKLSVDQEFFLKEGISMYIK